MEYIGMIISFLALLYLFFKQQTFVRNQQEQAGGIKEAEEGEEGEEDPLKEFMKAMDKREQREVRHAPPPPHAPKQSFKQHAKSHKQHRKSELSPLKEYRQAGTLEKRQVKSSLEDRTIKPTVGGKFLPHHEGEENQKGPSKAELAIRRLANRRDLLIYQEIMDKPKSMRPSP